MSPVFTETDVICLIAAAVVVIVAVFLVGR